MAVTRRQFLLGAISGLVLPSFFERAFSYCENHREPLLIKPKRTTETLYASPELTTDGFRLHLGGPHDACPDEMTIREFCIAYGEGEPVDWWREYWICEDESEPINLDKKMDQSVVEDWWIMQDSPYARAYHYLESIDLGHKFNNARVAGGLDFYCGGAPGNSFLAVDAIDVVSLSLLQQRLNELETGIRVELY